MLDFEAPSWLENSDRGELSESDLSFVPDCEPGLVKQAGIQEITWGQHGSTFAGSESLLEIPELLAHVKDLVEEKTPYLMIEEQLQKLGYQRHVIRKVFQQVTSIDPVQAYLDVDMYEVPPDGVPRYNYGWGRSKKKEADYYFILPFYGDQGEAKSAIFKQKGFDRELVEDFWSITEAREALKKLVKEVTDVGPETAQIDNLKIHPLFRVANLSAQARELYEKIQIFKNAELSRQLLNDAISADVIAEDEYELLCRAADEDDDSPKEETPEEKQTSDIFRNFQREEEGRNLEDVREEVKVPTVKFNEEKSHQVSRMIPELTEDAFKVFDQITSLIPEYKFSIQSSDVDLLDVESTSEDGSHIDLGSMHLISKVRDLQSNEERLILVLMFIRDGKIQYSGRFKGENNREYGLNDAGLQEYFRDLEGDMDLDRGPTTPEIAEVTGPGLGFRNY